MWTSKQRTGLYCNWSVGTLTTFPKDGSDRVVFHAISLFQILKWRVPVWYLWRSLVRHWNGQVRPIVGGGPGTCILIVDYGEWCKTSCTALPGQPLHLAQSMYIPMDISCPPNMRSTSKRKSGRGGFHQALKDRDTPWCWVLAISRSVNDNLSGSARSSASRIATFDKLRQVG